MKELIINERYWMRGEDPGVLYNSFNGKMCILGFLGLSCGLSREDMLDISGPDTIDKYNLDKWPEEIVDYETRINTLLCEKIISVNDDESISDDKRKADLKELFESIELRPVYING